MKRKLTLLLCVVCIFALICALVGCGNTNNPDDTKDPTKDPNNSPVDTEPDTEQMRLDTLNSVTVDASAVSVTAKLIMPDGNNTDVLLNVVPDNSVAVDAYIVGSNSVTALALRDGIGYEMQINQTATVSNVAQIVAAEIKANPESMKEVGTVQNATEYILNTISQKVNIDLDTLKQQLAPIINVIKDIESGALPSVSEIAETLSKTAVKVLFNTYTKNADGCVLSVDFDKLQSGIWKDIYAVAELIDNNSKTLTISTLFNSEQFRKVAAVLLDGVMGAQMEQLLAYANSKIDGGLPFDVLTSAGETAYTYLSRYLTEVEFASLQLGMVKVSYLLSEVATAMGYDSAVDLTDLLDAAESPTEIAQYFKNISLRINSTNKLQQIVLQGSVATHQTAETVELSATIDMLVDVPTMLSINAM